VIKLNLFNPWNVLIFDSQNLIKNYRKRLTRPVRRFFTLSDSPFTKYLRMTQISYLSQEGYDKLKSELDEMRTVGRRDAARAIAEAREKGDLSENAEYDAAKDAQGFLEARINELEKVLSSARVLDASKLDASKVVVFSRVDVLNMKTKKEMQFQLVSETEADMKTKRISVTSPIGKGLLGKAIGDVAEITTPAGPLKFKILKISLD